MLQPKKYHFFSFPQAVQQEQLERFKGVCALYGYEGLLRLQDAHVIVIGNGGVGSWAAECLCRTGVGKITLLDSDAIELSNSNRQLHTLSSTIGKGKSATLGARLKDINPYLELKYLPVLITRDNVTEMMAQALEVEPALLRNSMESELNNLPDPALLASELFTLNDQLRQLTAKSTAGVVTAATSAPAATSGQAAAPTTADEYAGVSAGATAGGHASNAAHAAKDDKATGKGEGTSPNKAKAKEHNAARPAIVNRALPTNVLVVEAIDDLMAKAAVVDCLHRARIPLLTSGGAGGRMDPSRIRLGDVSTAKGDQLIKRLRIELRRHYGYPKGNEDEHKSSAVSKEAVAGTVVDAVAVTAAGTVASAVAGVASQDVSLAPVGAAPELVGQVGQQGKSGQVSAPVAPKSGMNKGEPANLAKVESKSESKSERSGETTLKVASAQDSAISAEAKVEVNAAPESTVISDAASEVDKDASAKTASASRTRGG